jgi:hypothetical protein
MMKRSDKVNLTREKWKGRLLRKLKEAYYLDSLTHKQKQVRGLDGVKGPDSLGFWSDWRGRSIILPEDK